MSSSPDWRDVFCGRDDELKQLIGAYDAVTNGAGPRLAVVCAERGMGKTRLVQELYRTNCRADAIRMTTGPTRHSSRATICVLRRTSTTRRRRHTSLPPPPTNGRCRFSVGIPTQ